MGDTVSNYVDFIPWLDHPVGFYELSPVPRVTDTDHFTTTIFRGPLLLPAGKKCVVFDITGRIVLPDKIQPGVYFIGIDGRIVKKVIKVQ